MFANELNIKHVPNTTAVSRHGQYPSAGAAVASPHPTTEPENRVPSGFTRRSLRLHVPSLRASYAGVAHRFPCDDRSRLRRVARESSARRSIHAYFNTHSKPAGLGSAAGAAGGDASHRSYAQPTEEKTAASWSGVVINEAYLSGGSKAPHTRTNSSNCTTPPTMT